MFLRNYFSLAVFVTAVLFLNSCNNLKDLQCTGLNGFKVHKITTEGIDAEILLGIKNPNPYGFSIYKSEFDITYSGVYVGKAKLIKTVKIKGNEEKTYSFILRNDFKDLNLLDVMKLLSGATFKNLLEVKGELKVGKVFIKKRIPIDMKEKVGLN
jgi:LEA14-like dessication related protein